MIHDIIELSKTRIKNTLFCYYTLGWLFFNYQVPLVIIFSKRSIEDKIIYINNINMPIEMSLYKPLAFAACAIITYRFLFTWISYIIDYIINRFVLRPIESKNYKELIIKERYKKDYRKEALKQSDSFLIKELEQEIENKRLIQEEKQIELNQKKNILKKDLALIAPEVKEDIINHVSFRDMNSNGRYVSSHIMKESKHGPVYRFNQYSHGIQPGKRFDIITYIYRELENEEKISLTINNSKTNLRYILLCNEDNSKEYYLKEDLSLDLLGRYDASLNILDKNGDNLDIVKFTIHVDKH